MKFTTFAYLAPFLASAIGVRGAPQISHRSPGIPTSFTVSACLPGSSIDQLPMQAGGLRFRLGGQASTYCPTMVQPNCPPGVDTVITGVSIMDVMVPGGQQMYVDPSGAIGYTQAHSAFIPPGSTTSGFALSPGSDPDHAHYYFTGLGANGFMACPSADNSYYQVFVAMPNATVPTGNVSDCLEFHAIANAYTGPAPPAWQYA